MTQEEKSLKKIRLAIAGIGNCASSLVQGEYYKHVGKESCIGLMHYDINGYRAGDIDVVAAFCIDARKVGKDVSQAIFAKPTAPISSTLIFPKKMLRSRWDLFLTALHLMENYPEGGSLWLMPSRWM